MKPIYFPREDSEMLVHQVQRYAKGVVLDIGTGTGIQAIAAASSSNVKKIYATDINKTAIKFCVKNARFNSKIEYFVSDLFSAFRNKNKFRNIRFDTIIFNPPYLPSDHQVKGLAVIGGKKGWEVIEHFLNEVNDFLANEGIILLVFSSLTNINKVDELIALNLFEKKVMHTARFFYETLYVYLIKKNVYSKSLGRIGVTKLKFLDKGKRKVVYTGIYRGKKVAVKMSLPGKKVASIIIEGQFLKKLNKQGIGPKLIVSSHDFFIAEFVEGTFLKDFLADASKQKIKFVLKEVLLQCYTLDKLGINKEEMHHPLKHVLIKGKSVKMIDFERCRFTLNPKNVTQFCQFMLTNTLLLQKKGFNIDNSEIIYHAKAYKSKPSKKKFNEIVNLLENGH